MEGKGHLYPLDILKSEMPTKQDLGVSYLLGSGLGLIATLTWFYLITDDVHRGLLIASVTAAILAGTIVFVGYWLYHTHVSGDTAWRVAKWSAIGFAVPVGLSLVLLQFSPTVMFQSIVPGIFINLVAVGGVVGLLLGLVLEMRREQTDLRQLNQRNKVLNRILRHNIRNDMNVMQLHVDLLDEETNGDTNGSLDALRRKIQEVVSTSTAARRIEQLDSESLEDGPVDVVTFVEDQLDTLRSTYPEADVTTDLPNEAWASVGPIFGSVIDNVLENAIEHHPGDPAIDVTVDASTGEEEPVRITVTDDGSGIPDSEVRAVEEGESTQLDHGTGLGLWLVKWIVDHYDGNIQFRTPRSGGTEVVIDIPSAAERQRPNAAPA